MGFKVEIIMSLRIPWSIRMLIMIKKCLLNWKWLSFSLIWV